MIEIGENQSENLQIDFKPTGVLNLSEKTFLLELNVKISDKESTLKIEVEFSGYFTFKDSLEEHFENYLLANAPAIIFPYVRAYVTTLTSLSGITPVILPTMNLSGLKTQLQDNIKRINLT